MHILKTKKISNTASVIAEGIDVRADGGLIWVPPSIGYKFVNRHSIKPLPRAFVEYLRESAAPSESNQKTLRTLAGVGHGARNDTLFRYACSLRGRRMTKEEAAELVTIRNENCKPPITPEEIKSCIISAWQYKPHYSLNDMGNSQRFVKFFADKVRHCSELKSWYIAEDNGLWKKATEEEIIGLAKLIPDTVIAEAENEEDDDKKKRLTQHARSLGNIGRLRQMVATVQSEADIRCCAEGLDSNPFLLGTKNWVINLKTGKPVKQLKRDTMITKRIGTIYNSKADCPIFKKFLSHIFNNDSAAINYIQRVIGYILTGDTSEQCIFMFVGTGSNGKSTLFNVLKSLLKDYASTMPTDALNVRASQDNPALAALHGMRFVVAPEVSAGSKLDLALIKRLTGQDTITARYLHQNYFEYVPSCKLVLSGNQLPSILHPDYATARRIKIVDFKVCIPDDKQDKTLQGKMLKELPGILNWALEGCLEWQRIGLAEPSYITSATTRFLDSGDPVGCWLRERSKEEKGVQTSATKLYENFAEWQDSQEYEPLSSREFFRVLAKKYPHNRKKTNKGFAYSGLTLKPASQQ